MSKLLVVAEFSVVLSVLSFVSANFIGSGTVGVSIFLQGEILTGSNFDWFKFCWLSQDGLRLLLFFLDKRCLNIS